MKIRWEPIVAMVLVMALGLWIVYAPPRSDVRPGATTQKFVFAADKGDLETLRAPDGTLTFRLLWRDGSASDVIDQPTFARIFGQTRLDRAVAASGNKVFRALNITSWAGVAWVGLGLFGQLVFSGRFIIQWLVSERERRSVIPQAFWWLSLAGAVLLFTYFVWRQDVVGVLGQTSGLVIYARNIRLIHKDKARQRAESSGARPNS